MKIKPSISKRAIRITTALALIATMSVIAVSLLMTDAGATAFNVDRSDSASRHIPIPAQYTAQCSNGTAVPNPDDNPGLVADCAVLLAAKETLEGTTGNLNWSADRAISDWDRVATANSRVSGLYLTSKSLNGTIPAELGNLDNLRRLWLHINNLTGEIPSELGNLDDLTELDLSDNSLTGKIPSELGNLRDLGELHLQNNSLTGEIPSELGNLRDLRELSLQNNRLTGEIPVELGNLNHLSRGRLILYNNQFTGCIPGSLRVPLGIRQITVIGLPICGTATATPTPTATSVPDATPTPTATPAPRTTATATPTPTSALGATPTPTPTATSVPSAPATPVATPTPTATSVASSEVMNRLTTLERQVAEIPELKQQIAAMSTRIAKLEDGSGTGAATATPTPTATPASVIEPSPTPTATSVAGTSASAACVTPLAANASVTGSWTPACLSTNSPNNRTYYARFYTFTLSAASDTTITLSSNAAAPYLFLREGAGKSGAVMRETGSATSSAATITMTLSAGNYTIEASTWESETPGNFTLELEIAP